MVDIVFPRKVFDYHRVGSFVPETTSCLQEVVVFVLSIVRQQVVLVLQIHVLQLDMYSLDLLEQRLVLQQSLAFASQFLTPNFIQIQPLYPLTHLHVHLFMAQSLQIVADFDIAIAYRFEIEERAVLDELFSQRGHFSQ